MQVISGVWKTGDVREKENLVDTSKVLPVGDKSKNKE